MNPRMPVLLMRSVAFRFFLFLFSFYTIEEGVCWLVILLSRWLRSP